MTGDIAALETVLIFEGFFPDAAWTKEQYIMIAKMQQIGEFPLIAEGSQPGMQFTEELPASGLFFIEQYTAAFFRCLCAQEQIGLAVSAKPAGSFAVGIACGQVENQAAVLADRTVRLQGPLALADSSIRQGVGIDDMEVAISGISTASTTGFLCGNGPKRQLGTGVMDEIPGTDMAPAVGFRFTVQWVPLVKDMVFFLVKQQAIRIADTAERHFQMEAVMPAMLERKGVLYFFVNFCFFKPIV